MNLLDIIPTGKKNAISRNQLRALSGLSDRAMREQIAETRREIPIINDQTGIGYYIPAEEDIEEAKAFLRQEEARAKSIFWSIRGLRRWIKKVEKQGRNQCGIFTNHTRKIG